MSGIPILSVSEALNLISNTVILTCLSVVAILSFFWFAQLVLSALKGVLR